MKLKNQELENLMVELANERYGSQPFRRRDLMKMTEQEVRKRGLWTPTDDGSVGSKSPGYKKIDFRFFELSRADTFVYEDKLGVWRLASPKQLSQCQTSNQ